MSEPIQTILHVDLDAFFASVEQRDHPELRGKPVLVGGTVERGVVAAASYEARRYGIRSAMPMAEAMRRCPHAVVVRHRMDRYTEASRGFFAILEDFSPLVESLSLDEGFLDVTGSERLFGDGPTIARSIKQRVARELRLVASVGVAPTKFVAKIASDIDKPDGLCVVPPDGVLGFLHPLPLARLWGVGRVTQERLQKLGLRTIGDVARCPASTLRSQLGPGLSEHLGALAQGLDPRRVSPDHERVSIGHEQTFETDLHRRQDIATHLLDQADRVAARLRRGGLRARTVQLKIKYADFRLLTRRQTLADSTSDGRVIGRIATGLLSQLAIDDRHGKRHRVRLCGVSVSGLEDRDGPRQLTLSEPERARGERLGDALDRIEARFGQGLVRRAVHAGARRPTGPPKRDRGSD